MLKILMLFGKDVWAQSAL